MCWEMQKKVIHKENLAQVLHEISEKLEIEELKNSVLSPQTNQSKSFNLKSAKNSGKISQRSEKGRNEEVKELKEFKLENEIIKFSNMLAQIMKSNKQME